jgi:hypothetical protein
MATASSRRSQMVGKLIQSNGSNREIRLMMRTVVVVGVLVLGMGAVAAQ